MKNLIKEFEKKISPTIAEEWDNVGLLIGDRNKKVKKVLVTLDITNKVVEFAIENKIDVIFSHHPLIFSKLNKIVSSDLIGNRIIKLIKNDINVYAAHTNLDFVEGGLNDYLIKILDLEGKIIKKESPVRYFSLKDEIDSKELALIIKNKLGLNNVRIVGNKKVKKIALVTGAGSSFLRELHDVDMYITGDLTHHNSLDYKEKGMVLLDIGHYGSEKFALNLLKEIIIEIDNNLNVIEYIDEEVFEIL